VVGSSVKIKEPGKSPEIIETQLLAEEDENGIFKDNEWELKDSSFSSPEMKSKLVDPIKQFVSDFASGEITDIEYIVIQSSANRYRNTGISEGISWGELSFNRAKTIAGIFKAAADEYELTESQRKTLQDKISIDYGGSNGDGTSGPNPVDPIPFGYYDKSGKFIRDNGTYGKRSTVVIDEIGKDGKPTGKITTETIEPDGDKSAYEKYKYVNVVIKYTKTDADDIVTFKKTDEKFEYKGSYRMPRKTSKIPPPKRKPQRRIGTPGRGQGKGECPYKF
jgi:hypothetical protein